VWRSWFAGDRTTLEKVDPDERIAIDPAGNTWSNRQTILDGSTSSRRAAANW